MNIGIIASIVPTPFFLSLCFSVLIATTGTQAHANSAYDLLPMAPGGFRELVTTDSELTQGREQSVSHTNKHGSVAYVSRAGTWIDRLWVIDPNLWGIEADDGSVDMQYTGDGQLVIRNNLTGVSGKYGYPHIQYGKNPWGVAAGGQPPQFPIPLSAMIGLTSRTDYELAVHRMSGNISYDLWLTPDARSRNADQALEVMIWLWRRGQNPAGTLKETVKFPMIFNGKKMNAKFGVYVREDVISFLIDEDQAISSGDVTINLSTFVQYALQKANISLDSYLQGIQFGTEFNAHDQDYTFVLKRMEIQQFLP